MSQIGKAIVARPKSGKPKKGRTMCPKCGERFSPVHKCPPGPRQPTYANVEPPAVSRAKGREQDETKNTRITSFTKATAGTTMRATKLAGATKQGSKPADKPHAARHNEKFIGTKNPVAANATSTKWKKNKPSKTQDQVQADLIHATRLCLANSGGTTPFQNILDAVGNAADRRRIIKWAETFAPVRMEKDKMLLNKTAWDLLDRKSALANFAAYIKETGMANDKWYLIAKKTSQQNTWVSIVSGGGGPGTGKKR